MNVPREFPCRIDAVTDGDTMIVTIDAGFRVHIQSKVRLAGIDCPELSTPEGREARNFVLDWIDNNDNHTKWPFLIICYGYDKRDKYGRWLGDIAAETMSIETLVASLKRAGHVK